jgi:Uma2 family endonuclease
VFVAAVSSLIPRSEGMATMHAFGGDSGFYDHHSSTGGSRASTEGSVPAVGTHSDDVPIVGSDEPSPFFVKLMEERASVAAHLKANAQKETLPPGPCGYCLGKATLAEFKALDHEMEKQGVHYKMAYVNGSIFVDELASPAHCLISSQFDQLVNSYEDALKARYHTGNPRYRLFFYLRNTTFDIGDDTAFQPDTSFRHRDRSRMGHPNLVVEVGVSASLDVVAGKAQLWLSVHTTVRVSPT